MGAATVPRQETQGSKHSKSNEVFFLTPKPLNNLNIPEYSTMPLTICKGANQ